MCEEFEPIKIVSVVYICWNVECNHEIEFDVVQKLGLTTCPKCGESLWKDEHEHE